MKQIAEVFGSESFTGLRNLIDGANLVLQWEKAVDRTIAAETEALRFEKGTIFIKVKSPAWANELKFLKGKMIERLNKYAGKKIVNDIRFLVKGDING